MGVLVYLYRILAIFLVTKDLCTIHAKNLLITAQQINDEYKTLWDEWSTQMVTQMVNMMKTKIIYKSIIFIKHFLDKNIFLLVFP